MKKILSFILALTMCLGIFVSCKNEEEPPRQEKEDMVKYYKKAPDFDYVGIELPSTNINSPMGLPYGTYYTLITTYDQFLNSVSDPEPIDEDFFEENFLYVICEYSTINPRNLAENEIGYRNFYIDKGIAYLTLDKTFAFGVNSHSYGNGGTRLDYTYLIIPKENLNGKDTSTVQSYKVFQNKVQYYYSEYYSAETLNGDYKNGDAWILNDEKSYEDFKENVYPIIRNLDFEENIYMAVYREGADLSDEIGYFDLTNEGEEVKLTALSFPNNQSDYESTGSRLNFIIVPRGRLKFSVDTLKSIKNIKIEIKDIEYFN